MKCYDKPKVRLSDAGDWRKASICAVVRNRRNGRDCGYVWEEAVAQTDGDAIRALSAKWAKRGIVYIPRPT